MKYIFICSILILLLSSCTKGKSKLPVAERVARVPGIESIYKFTFEGHDYLYSYRTGMIHSESCEASEHYGK